MFYLLLLVYKLLSEAYIVHPLDSHNATSALSFLPPITFPFCPSSFLTGIQSITLGKIRELKMLASFRAF